MARTKVRNITYKQQLVEAKLGMQLREWTEQQGLVDASLRDVCAALKDATGLNVGSSTLHEWLAR
jgi:hypothetical protein